MFVFLKHEYLASIQQWELCFSFPSILSAYISESISKSITHPASFGIFPLSSLFF